MNTCQGNDNFLESYNNAGEACGFQVEGNATKTCQHAVTEIYTFRFVIHNESIVKSSINKTLV